MTIPVPSCTYLQNFWTLIKNQQILDSVKISTNHGLCQNFNKSWTLSKIEIFNKIMDSEKITTNHGLCQNFNISWTLKKYNKNLEL